MPIAQAGEPGRVRRVAAAVRTGAAIIRPRLGHPAAPTGASSAPPRPPERPRPSPRTSSHPRRRGRRPHLAASHAPRHPVLGCVTAIRGVAEQGRRRLPLGLHGAAGQGAAAERAAGAAPGLRRDRRVHSRAAFAETQG